MTRFIWNGDVFIFLGAMGTIAIVTQMVRKETPWKDGTIMLAALLVSAGLLVLFTLGGVRKMDLVTLSAIGQLLFYQLFFRNVARRQRSRLRQG